MFQPQSTSFAASCFSSVPYGIGPAHDLGFLLPVVGGRGVGPAAAPLFSSQPAAPSSLMASHVQTVEQEQQQQRERERYRQQQQQQQQNHHHHHHHNHPQHHQHDHDHDHDQHYDDAPIKMEHPDPNPHDLAAQQAAAKDYQPVLEGPMVGEKTSIEIITHEYAKADPVYVQKTIALPQTYSHYRPIQGDGNCGWRAIGFAYYETLLNNGNQGQIEGEVARLTSLNPMIGAVGRYDYYEDFAEEAIGLLRDLAANAGDPGLAQVLLRQRWNDTTVQASLIYYFRLLAGTYLKGHADTYDPFVPDGLGIASYCSQMIETVDREIEHLGIVGLANMLLKPINFVLEIAYLDRSAGSQVNRFRFPEEANGQDPADLGPKIDLLYRPDHYDILYRAPPISPPAAVPVPVSVPAPVGPVNLQVNRVTGFSSNMAISSTHGSLGAFATSNMSALAMIPGFGHSGLGSLSPLGSLTSTASPVSEAFAPSQQHSPWFVDGLPSQPSPPPPPPVVSPAPLTPSTPLTPSPSMVGSSSLGSAHGSGLLPNPSLAPAPGYHIRFSPVQLEYEESKSNFPEPTFQVTTNTFKNSVWNRAHYGNPNFHPEEWTPEDDHADGRMGGRRKMRKDS